MPVSVTEKRIRVWYPIPQPLRATLDTEHDSTPRWVNLTALPSKIDDHLAQAQRIPDQDAGHVGGDVAGKLQVLDQSRAAPSSRPPYRSVSRMSKSTSSKLRCPLSILARSSMSLIRSSRMTAITADDIQVMTLLDVQFALGQTCRTSQAPRSSACESRATCSTGSQTWHARPPAPLRAHRLADARFP